MPNPILPSRAAPRASASCCTPMPAASRRAPPELCSFRRRRLWRRRTEAVPPSLICVLPLNAPAEQVFEINTSGLEVRTDQLVSFQACSSTRHDRCRPGDVLPWDADAFHMLPPLETIIRKAHGADVGPDRTAPVRLAAKMNALGLLQISCVGTDPQTPQSWPLEFNLRPHEHGGAAARGTPAPAPVAPNATTEAQQAARDHIAIIFTRPPPKSDRLTANAVLKSMERLIGLPRHEWNAALLRNLWPSLIERIMGRKLSVEHEEAWLTLAGFLLRPGFGFAHDGLRMDELWRLRDAGLYFPGKRSKVQEYILWRQVAGGLTAERQELLLAGELASIRAGKASPELVRLAGSLERLPRETKAELIEAFIAHAARLIEAKQHCAPHLAALGLLLNRTPLYAGPETVVAADFVAQRLRGIPAFELGRSRDDGVLQPLPQGGARCGRPKLGCPQVAARPDRPQAGARRYRAQSRRYNQGVHPSRAHRPHHPVRRAAAPGPGARRRPELSRLLFWRVSPPLV